MSVAFRSSIWSTMMSLSIFRIAGSNPSNASSITRYFVPHASATATTACRFIPLENVDIFRPVGSPRAPTIFENVSWEKVS